MDNFIVSARKYRPVTFETVVGQKSITGTLKNAIKQQQLAQAFLFCGPRGVGKTTCARILAKTINCQNLSSDYEACNVCPSCKSFQELTSFNIFELDAASNNSVDDIRSLTDQVRIPPQAGKYKVYIIDEVHMLSQQAFNAFLKTLEEPPSYAKFILATTEKHKIIPTVLSRCQIFDFKRITVDDIASHLAYVAKNEQINFDPDALHLIAQKADGALRDALSIFDQIAISSGNNISYQAVVDNLNILDYEYYFKLTDIILDNNVFDAFILIDKIIENGFDGQILLSGFASHLRNVLVSKDEVTLKLLESSENIKNRYKLLAQRCSEKFLISTLEVIGRFDYEYKSSNNKRLHLELAFMKMCNLQADFPSTYQVPEIKKKTELTNSEDAGAKVSSTGTAFVAKKPVQNVKVAVAPVNNIISLKENNNQEEISVVAESTIEYGECDFDKSEFEQTWMKMSIEYEKQSSFYMALTKNIPEMISPVDFVFYLDNKILLKEFISKKPTILHFLRTNLKNKNISIEEKLNTVISQELKPYKAEDKYKKMVEDNPDIQAFKDQLNLEIDY